MNLPERIEDICCMGINRTRVEINSLVKDVLDAVSYHFAISADDLMKAVVDGVPEEHKGATKVKVRFE